MGAGPGLVSMFLSSGLVGGRARDRVETSGTCSPPQASLSSAPETSESKKRGEGRLRPGVGGWLRWAQMARRRRTMEMAWEVAAGLQVQARHSKTDGRCTHAGTHTHAAGGE